MPTEAELRALLHGEEAEPGALNAARIIRRAKTRRRPKQLAAGLAGGVAAVGAIAFTVPALLGLVGGGLMSSAGGAADEGVVTFGDAADGTQEGPQTELRSAEPCRSALVAFAEVAPSSLSLAIDAAALDDDATRMAVTVTLVNTGDTAIAGTADGAPAMMLTQEGMLMGTAEFTGGPFAVNLAPGQSIDLMTSVTPVACAADGTTLQALPAGDYELTATVAVQPDDGSGPWIAMSPPTHITLR